ncbi:hypothetical protein DFAR_1350010 [Desulfarculales bacterium]
MTVKSGDAPALVSALVWLLESPVKAQFLGAALKNYVWSIHNRGRLLDEVPRLYEEAAGGD